MTQRSTQSCPRSGSPATRAKDWSLGGRKEARLRTGCCPGKGGGDAALRFHMDAESCELAGGGEGNVVLEMEEDDFSRRSQPRERG